MFSVRQLSTQQFASFRGQHDYRGMQLSTALLSRSDPKDYNRLTHPDFSCDNQAQSLPFGRSAEALVALGVAEEQGCD